MRSWRNLTLASPALLLGVALTAGAQKPAPAPQTLTPDQTQFFEKKVRPLLMGKCSPCHVDGVSRGNLSLDTREAWQVGGASGPAIVPGNPERSLLLQRVKSTSAPMPPGGKLSADEIATLESWIKMGAPDPRSAAAVTTGKLTGLTDKARAHWAFQPVEKPAIPKVKNAAWVKNPVDSFVLAKLEAGGMKPNPAASRAALIRRVYYDLIGLPPSVDEVRAFLADKSPNAYEKVVDHLLASPHYGERWGRHWLDTARYADTTGNMQQAGRNRFADFRYANAWTYRDWVVSALNADIPYNQFLMAQLAADLMPTTKDDPKQLAALGFLTVGKRFNDTNDEIDERIDTVSKATMGVTIACARCHDHKFDPIPTADYYSLHGIFASIDEPELGPEIPGTGDPSQRADYEQQLQVLLAQGRNAYFDYVGEKQATFERNAAGYLMLRATNPRSKEATDIAERYGLNITAPRQRDTFRVIEQGIRTNPNAPSILMPLTVLSRLNGGNFAQQYAFLVGRMTGGASPAAQRFRNARPRFAQQPALPNVTINPIIAQELASLKPSSIDDVAAAYGRVFERLAPQRAAYFEAKKRGQNPRVDAATAQLLEFPLPLPTAEEFNSPQKLRRMVSRFQGDLRATNLFPFDAINRLALTHPGAPGHAMVVEDVEEPRDSRILIRGEKQRPGEFVPRRVPQICTTGERKSIAEGSGRLEFARAIAAPSNPLTARALVNRVWMQHFGAAFVRTPDDLGTQSEKPSHPELLDWLAGRFMETGWSLKKLHKWIVLSNTYQQSVETHPDYEKRDPQNRLLWRQNLRRLDFESIRDTLVFLTGKMDPTIGGKPVNITDEPYIYRRSIYGYIDRLFLSDLLTQFDVSDPTMANSGRITTIVPQQALFFMNSPMAVDVARQVVARPELSSAASDTDRVQAIYRILFQRSARPEEVQLALGFLNKSTTVAKGPEATAPQARPGGRFARRPMPLAQQAGQRGGKFAPIRNNTERVERKQLDSWELLTQALLCSNEFVYVN